MRPQHNYPLFAAGYFCSGVGLQMFTVAVMWEVYERTDSTFMVGLIGLVRALPVLALALPAGYVIDLVSRRHILAATQIGFALTMLGMAAVSHAEAPLWLLYVLIGLSGCTRVFNGPVRASLLPDLVPLGSFHRAVAWTSGLFQAAAIGGPIVAGVLLEAFDATWPIYLITAVLCAVFAVTAMFLRPRPNPRPVGPIGFKGMLGGLSHVYREKTILGTITLDLFAVLLGGAVAVFPEYARDILHTDATGLGLLKASPYVGALLMSVVLAKLPPLARPGKAMLWSVALFGIATIGFGFSTNLWLSLALLLIGGAADTISVVVRHILVQLRTPVEVRGRVSSVNSVFIESSNELGAFESGLVAKFFGPVASVVSGGIGTVLVVIGIAWAFPQIRKLGELKDEYAEDAKPAAAEPATA